jgi:hypothetical protein
MGIRTKCRVRPCPHAGDHELGDDPFTVRAQRAEFRQHIYRRNRFISIPIQWLPLKRSVIGSIQIENDCFTDSEPSHVHQAVTHEIHATPLVRITRFCEPDPRLRRSLETPTPHDLSPQLG